MIIEKVLGKRPDSTKKRIDVVTLEWHEREKKRMRKTTSAGEEIGIMVEVPLKEGDILAEDESRIIVVEYVPCEVMQIPVSTMQEMGRLCFELGNRHLSLEIGKDKVCVPFDEPTFLYLQQLGFQPEKTYAKLADITVCKGHSHGDGEAGHHHHSEHEKHHHGEHHHE